MAAKQHTTVIGWASDHWFLSFLLVSSAISIPIYAFGAVAAIAAPKPGPTPFPSSKP